MQARLNVGEAVGIARIDTHPTAPCGGVGPQAAVEREAAAVSVHSPRRLVIVGAVARFAGPELTGQLGAHQYIKGRRSHLKAVVQPQKGRQVLRSQVRAAGGGVCRIGVASRVVELEIAMRLRGQP